MDEKLYDKMNASNMALLVIDVINSCASEQCEWSELGITFSKIRKMVPKLSNFIDLFRQKVGGHIVFANTVPWKKEYLAENINELYADPQTTYYSKDETGFSEKFYKVTPEKEDIVITKNSYDAFTNPELNKVLKEKGIKYIVVAGIFGDGCVHATIAGGFSAGYNFIILKDLIETADVPIRQELQQKLKDYTWPIMYGSTLNSDDFLKSWKR